MKHVTTNSSDTAVGVQPAVQIAVQMAIQINGRWLAAQTGESVLAALQRAGHAFTRRDLVQAPRAALCGMGVCQECAVTIDDEVGQLACLRRCRSGMRVQCDV